MKGRSKVKWKVGIEKILGHTVTNQTKIAVNGGLWPL